MSTDLTQLQKEIVSGLTAGTLTTLIVHPLDLIKIRLQLLVTSQNNSSGYAQIIKSLITSQKNHPIKEIYRGLAINIFGNAIAWGLYFGFYRTFKDYLYNNYTLSLKDLPKSNLSSDSKDAQLTPLMYLTASACSGISTTLITNPIWVLKTRIMSTSVQNPDSYKSIKDGLTKLLRTEGISSLWRGLIPSVFGVGQGAIYFMTYDSLKKKVLSYKIVKTSSAYEEISKNNSISLNTFEIISITSLSKMFSVSTTYPFQLIKSNLQSFNAYNHNYKLLQFISTLYKKRGIRGFYKGLLTNLVRTVPSTCITFCTYECFKKHL
ncbi:hypothetical protein TBLA_0G02640 [Henningerozyma blattae CBS 6284]|uniref:Mitochondrial FAD carrier protein FLX1 n=1 Tax=Henningerozyma blattae (strain ATCC 34711 / CBS 6284 / DSM 70876 / NBRC 10599 / NRRL Y-10934 / UCD 77-7) TaxID=1071380 RepID=I2H750_HENB6|nr:hypothetical protein TBLA_0G02640 [Tetrapisispora blattae CBS 6284]CCH62202.1 hypothetical protein TBLA_0G02640 [Tetrapisispora blattae CBS 6284]